MPAGGGAVDGRDRRRCAVDVVDEGSGEVGRDAEMLGEGAGGDGLAGGLLVGIVIVSGTDVH